MDHHHQISTLLAWCALNGLEIDSRLKLDWDPNTQTAVYTKGSNIPPNTKLVRIPRHAVLSTKSCTLSEYMSSTPYGLGAQLSLSLALYAEILKGKFSRWSGYLQSLPHNDVDIPVFWDLEMEVGSGELSSRRIEDGRKALEWLRGTEVGKILKKRSENNKNLLEELNDYYHEIAETLILRHRDKISSQFLVTPTLHGFHRAYALVSSRAFIVDAYHGLCMVPIADAFNHESPNHIHLESDYHVCPECGLLHECSHDWDNPPIVLGIDSTNTAHKAVAIDEDEPESDLFMVSVAAVPSRVEVFNTYGETLTNAQLLTQYGFILDANDNDCLTWDIYQLLHDLASDDQRPVVDTLWKQLCQSDWSLVSRSGLVHFTAADMDVTASPLTLNGDGKISHQMWLIVSMHAVHRAGKSSCNEIAATLSHLRSLLSTQMILEVHLERDETEGQVAGPTDSYNFDNKPLKELEELCWLMVHLCADRKAKTGPTAFSGTITEVGEYFDTLSHEKPRTRMAVSLVLNELSLLNSCQAMWTELLGMVQRVGERVP